ncbi:MAG: desulfoferrodoxin [Ruminiclostridium sp.]|nr:desulfoferrodoxin [Ruminiclostridium sp.]
MTPKFYKCKACGQFVAAIDKKACPIKCCGEAMEEVTANTVDAAKEKHVPAVTVDGSIVKVAVGTVEHPMTDAHLINWVCLETTRGMQRKVLTAADKPYAEFALTADDKAVAAYAYCNLHGLWKAEI